jgi:transposase
LADPVARAHRLSRSEESMSMSTSASAYLGIDIAKNTFEACLLNGTKAGHGSFANAPAGFAKLDRWLKKRKVERVHACLEATGRYSEGVAEHLHAAGHTVSVINPARLKSYAGATLTRTKTDQTDAALLAEFCRNQQPAAWTPPAAERRELRALVRRRESLLELRQREANRLSSGEDCPTVCASLEAVVAFLDEQLAKVEQAITQQIADDPDLQRQSELVDSIPGIGPTTAAALLAEIDFGAYPSARQVAAQAGLTPRQRQSGTSVHGKPRISKQGASQLRRILFFPAIVAMHHNPPIRAFAERLAQRGKAKMAIVCACMRKLLHLVYGVLKTGLPFDPDYRSTRVQPVKTVKELQPA